MEIINHETYISLEIAKLLKEVGFDWKVEHCYYNGEFDKEYYEPSNFNKDCLYQISAPTLNVAQRWLREVKGLHILIYTHAPAKWEPVIMWVRDYTVIKIAPEHSYEEAQEAGIKKILELILEKKVKL